MKKRKSKEERFPTKTDIKGIKRWLNRLDEEKRYLCPFDKDQFDLPHWKCNIIFKNLQKKLKEKSEASLCPCDNYTFKYVKTVAKHIVSFPLRRDLW